MLFGIVVLILLGLNGYLYIRTLQCLPHIMWLRVGVSILFWLALLSFMVGMFLGDFLPDKGILSIIPSVGYTWFIAAAYLIFFCLCIDFVRIINHFFHIYPQWITGHYQLTKLILAGSMSLMVIVFLFVGNYKYRNPYRAEVEIALNKELPDGELKIVMVSDVHLGNNIGKRELLRYVEMINSETPDLILIAGDLCDRSVKPLIKQNMREELSSLKSKYGVYFASGNHEFYGEDREQIFEYLTSAGINVLTDSVVTVGGVIIAGREDKTNKHRKKVSELLRGVDRSKPLILMDHQPFNLEDAEQAGVDLQLSGHTHNGQFWPGSWVVKMMYELPYGYMQKGNTHYYVSSGLGLWGPKYRVGTKSEMVVIKLISNLQESV